MIFLHSSQGQVQLALANSNTNGKSNLFELQWNSNFWKNFERFSTILGEWALVRIIEIDALRNFEIWDIYDIFSLNNYIVISSRVRKCKKVHNFRLLLLFFALFNVSPTFNFTFYSSFPFVNSISSFVILNPLSF